MPRQATIVNSGADIIKEAENGGLTDHGKPALPKIKVLGDRTLILRDEPIGKIGQIWVPDKAQMKAVLGTVLDGGWTKVGDKREQIVKEGQRVYFNDYGGWTHPDNKNVIAIRTDDIIAVME